MLKRFHLLSLGVLLGSALLAFAQTSGDSSRGSSGQPSSPSSATNGNGGSGSNNSSASAPINTDPSYKLSPGDSIAVAVTGQPDMSASETLGRSGDIRLPMITEEVILSGKTVREAEHYLENLYREKNLLKKPVVGIKVAAYSPREVKVLGAVRSPGTILFPRDVTSRDIVDVITDAGGFLPISKADAVTITRRTADGKSETTKTVDLENVMSGRRRVGRERADEPIYPGDRIFVPERLF